MKAEEVKGWNVFKQIFSEHWEGFKKKYPKYSEGHYEEQVKKMLTGCPIIQVYKNGSILMC